MTIKVSKPSEPVEDFGEPYNFQDLSQTQVTIIVEDIDDNPPMFETSRYVLGEEISYLYNFIISMIIFIDNAIVKIKISSSLLSCVNMKSFFSKLPFL